LQTSKLFCLLKFSTTPAFSSHKVQNQQSPGLVSPGLMQTFEIRWTERARMSVRVSDKNFCFATEIGKTYLVISCIEVGDFFALVSMKSPNFCQKAKF
jgi:hypothetical protein